MKLLKIFFIIFVIVTMADWFMAYIVSLKHPLYNEINLIYLLTGSIYLGLLFKVIYIYGVYWILKRYYNFSEIVRYAFIYIVCIALIVQFVGFLSGINEYNKEPSEIKPVPKEFLMEQNIELSKKTGIPFITYLLIFILFITIEKEMGFSKKWKPT